MSLPIPHATAAAASTNWVTLPVGTCNVLNMALPGHVFYEGQPAYDGAEYARKTDWLGGMLARLNADIVGFQEVWDEPALKAAVARSGLRYAHVLAPGAEQGATGTPRVGLASRLALDSVESVQDFALHEQVPIPEVGCTHASSARS